jgi:hypothetical protein
MDKEKVTNYEAVIEGLQRENERLRMNRLKDIRENLSFNLGSIEEFLQEHWHISLFLLATATAILQIFKGDKS